METVKWVAVHGGRRGHMIRVSRGDGSDCVAEEQNDIQEGFFFNRQGTFLVARALRLKKSGGDAEHVRRRKGPDVLKLALEEGVEPQEGVGRRGGREAPSNNPE